MYLCDLGSKREHRLDHRRLSLSKGKTVRVVGATLSDYSVFWTKARKHSLLIGAMRLRFTKAFNGADAAYLMLPPAKSRENQEQESTAIAQAVKESGICYGVHLSSYGAQVPEGTRPVAGLHSSEQKLNAIGDLNVLHLRAAYFMENNLHAIGMIVGWDDRKCAAPDVKLPMIATPDVGDFAAQRLLRLDFSGKQVRELLGERDLSMAEATAVIGRGIGQPI